MSCWPGASMAADGATFLLVLRLPPDQLRSAGTWAPSLRAKARSRPFESPVGSQLAFGFQLMWFLPDPLLFCLKPLGLP